MLKPATRVLSLGLLVLAAGCQTEGPTTPITFVGPSSLVVTDLRVGQGATLAAGQQATVNYSLWLYDPRNTDSKGTLVEASGNQGFTIRIATGTVIEGWVQGLPGMKVGGLRRLVIPPSLAFGSTGSQQIPPNAWLIFDVDLLAVAN